MRRHGRRLIGSLAQVYRDCRRCDYRDKVLIQPEQIVSRQPVIRRRIDEQTKASEPKV
jgi:hypothetical protein